MSKFKAGDPIRRIAQPIGNGTPLGYETEALSPVDGDWLWYTNAHGVRMSSLAANWELVQPVSSPSVGA